MLDLLQPIVDAPPNCDHLLAVQVEPQLLVAHVSIERVPVDLRHGLKVSGRGGNGRCTQRLFLRL